MARPILTERFANRRPYGLLVCAAAPVFGSALRDATGLADFKGLNSFDLNAVAVALCGCET